ncbi:UNVERIFIED_CONTAM: hypothetical protein Slati_1936100 [Sesamum latifolium]|uniref:Uncharacterized protein n=1 Tax=Sesamum latifolium TaxID=2727402 RepID=A0AAW2X5R5_9LAMI
MEKLRNDVSIHAYYRNRAEQKAGTLIDKNAVIRWDTDRLKAEHKIEVEQLQEENQQPRDQVNDLRDHIDQLAEMIPDEPEEDPEEDPMEHQDDDGELTDGSVTNEEV